MQTEREKKLDKVVDKKPFQTEREKKKSLAEKITDNLTKPKDKKSVAETILDKRRATAKSAKNLETLEKLI